MARILAIGDIHGCLTALDTLLGFVQPGPDDQLIFLGDYIDRGPDSKGVLDRLIELKRTRPVVCLRGNHEIMMLAGREGQDDFRFWMSFGGVETLGSYVQPGSEITLENIPYEHWHFVRQYVRRLVRDRRAQFCSRESASRQTAQRATDRMAALAGTDS